MIKIFTLSLSVFFTSIILAQEAKLYNPAADAGKEIVEITNLASSSHKYVLIMAGGNWCSWCTEFSRFIKADRQIDSVINSSFIFYHLNYSKENENSKIFARYGFPQRFGFPAFIILDENGKRIHTQNSEYLEDGKKSYNKNKVKDFLEMWSPKALDAKLYGGKNS
jgi:thioredoxin-related protein